MRAADTVTLTHAATPWATRLRIPWPGLALAGSLGALLATAWICVSTWRVLWLAAVAVCWVTPGVVAFARAYRESPSRLPMALLLGPAFGYAASSLCLLAVWLLGSRSGWWLVGAPAIAGGLAWFTPSLGRRLDVPRFDRRDLLAVALVLLIVPAVVARPYSRVGQDLPEGRAYRAYFTADLVWAMAVVSEVSKGDVPPANPYHKALPLHYYWLAHLLPAIEHRILRREVRLDHLLLANAVFCGAMFIAFLYGLGKQVARTAPATALGCIISVLFTSPEGLYALANLWQHDLPITLVRDWNIDAVTRWFFDTLPVDGLQRLLLYQPQHQIGYALACTALLVMVQQARRPRVRAAVASGVLLACGLLVSTFSALMVLAMVMGVGGCAVLRARAWRTGLLQAIVGAVPLALATWLGEHLHYVTGTGRLVDVEPNPLAVRHALAGLLLSMGPVLLTLAVGAWWLRTRAPRGTDRVLLPGIALAVSLFFYFFVDVRDHQDVYVGWRAGHLIFITAGGALGWTWWRITHARSRLWRAAGAVALVLCLGITAPTTIIDLYNTQDVANRSMAAGFPWTLVLARDEVNALQWIATSTPPDARVQVDPVARDPATWGYVPAFGERRMAAGIPISMVPLEPYLRASQRVRRVYRANDVNYVRQHADQLGIDVLVVGPEEDRAHPHFRPLLEGAPDAFPALYRSRLVSLYAASDRMRRLTRTWAPRSHGARTERAGPPAWRPGSTSAMGVN